MSHWGKPSGNLSHRTHICSLYPECIKHLYFTYERSTVYERFVEGGVGVHILPFTHLQSFIHSFNKYIANTCQASLD